ncbi:MAG: RluA family pseudouridine synthase [Leptospirales bacterium]|nr:RluA family pseudouridine synthase [Leptospirales bacterium]
MILSGQWVVADEDEGLRLDQWLASCLGDRSSRSQIQRCIDLGLVSGPGEVKASRQVRAGECYELASAPPAISELQAVDLGLQFVYEDPYLAVLHKPPGIAVHPGPGDSRPSIVHGLLHVWKERWSAAFADAPELASRPGVVHRLDRDTEGLLAVARDPVTHRKMSRLFAERQVQKIYFAWLLAAPQPSAGRIELALSRRAHDRRGMRVDPAGRLAITEYRVRDTIASRHGRKYSAVDLSILTGRTHQIRVHLAHLGAPVVGDPIYSRSAAQYERFGMLLLARKLAFEHPHTGEMLQFELALPERFLEFNRKAEYL